MLKLYYGRENLDKDRFLFDQVREAMGPEGRESGRSTGKLLLIVPDQFTLQAEQNAFDYLKLPGMMDLEILSQTRLGFRVLGETGGGTRLHIDQYGRHMILARIINERAGELTAYQGMKRSQSFIELANDFITEMKQNGVNAAGLSQVMEQVEPESLLYRKLSDMEKLFEQYEEALAGKYLDTEDYMELFTSKIPQSSLVHNSRIWFYGFDSFTEKSMQMIEALMGAAAQVTVIMTGGSDPELFSMTRKIFQRLRQIGQQAGVSCLEEEIGEEYQIPVKALDWNGSEGVSQGAAGRKRTGQLAWLEKQLYAYPHHVYGDQGAEAEGGASESIRFCRAANLYAEVETAAAQIVELTRERGLRYRDIALICNDLSRYGSVLKRVFSQYEIPIFLDEKRTVLHNPAAEMVNALLDIVVKGWQHQDIFRFLKTGLFEIGPEECQELENYAIKYRIRGRRWQSEFRYGISEYGEEGLERLSQLRLRLTEPLRQFEKEFHGAEKARDKSLILYGMLAEKLELPLRLEELLSWLSQREEFLAAEEISQIWGVLVQLLDQMVELLGDSPVTDEEYAVMLQSGLAAVEIGVLPPTQDLIIAGTMQRTRRGRTRAMIVIGANDGLLPADSVKEDLLSEQEKAELAEKQIVLCKNDDYRASEEQLAIYKNLSKPEEFLYLSYSVADLDGREKKPSLIFDKLAQIFSRVPVEKDIVNQEQDLARIHGGRPALPHMSEAFRRAVAGDSPGISSAWKLTYNFLSQEKEKKEWDQGLTALRRGLFFTNRVKRLEDRLVEQLYKREGMADFILSPSRLERFGKCPFSHFVQYGLSPEERRVFEVSGREVGDIYHQCLMELSQQLTLPGVQVTDGSSPWMTVTEEECQGRVGLLIDEIASGYREGVLTQGGEEKYRGERMKKIAGAAAWAMISHVRQGIIKEIYFEAGFGSGTERPFPPISVETAYGPVRIEGKIDRVDVLAGEAASYVKIVDYKSGSERFDMEEAREGIRLQLMLYLEGAMGGLRESRPAGVFYFEIAEPMVDASGYVPEELADKVAEQVRKTFKMDGVMVDEPAVIEGIAGEFSGFSDIVPVRKGAKGISGTSEGKILEPEVFEEFRRQVGETVAKLCGDLVSGDVGIHPKKTKNQNACKYCQFKGICCFDLSFEDCKYR